MDKIDPSVAGLVLVAALMHASWNAVVKSDTDRLASFGLVMLAGCFFGLAFVPFVKFPAPEAWPYLIGSAIVHVFYYFFLLRAYAHGDLSLVYPIARGLGPTLVAIMSSTVVGEVLDLQESIGVLLVSFGIAGLAFAHGLPDFGERRAIGMAVCTGITIAVYTILDGLGARASGDALGYIAWLNLLEGPWVFLFAMWKRGPALYDYVRKFWWRGSAGGVVATIGYGIAIWASSLGAIAHVSALRETSVLFASLMGTFLLGEKFGHFRIAAAAVLVAGLLAMNFKIG